ncbi:hypothetical protein IFM89_014707 [Coptis chinensis]|uniref:Uncharacterized protein n=1 Tax=Coptis chinensis TaxID=261450 RepID=A0A835LIM6_9MAGN|nr:hypothetical protein IFM89_014707 [Coptis chinensis]
MDVKNLKVHYGDEGSFTDIFGVDGDRYSLIDLKDDISNKIGMPALDMHVAWLHSGEKKDMYTDSDYLEMWANIEIDEKGFAHLFVILNGVEIVEPVPTPSEIVVPTTDSGNVDASKKPTKRGGAWRLPEEDLDELPQLVLTVQEVDEVIPINDGNTIDINNISPEEEYHSVGSDSEDEEFLLPSTNEFANFASKTDNLYDKEDNESRQTNDTNVQVELVLEVGMEWPTIQECRRKQKAKKWDDEADNKFRGLVPRVKQTIKTRIKFIRNYVVEGAENHCFSVKTAYDTRREEDEDAPSSKKKRTCKSCHLPGHNSRTCKGLPANIAKNANKEKEATTKKASTDKSKKGRSNTSEENCGTNGGGGVVDTTAAASSSQSNTPTSMFVVPTTKAPNIMPHLTSSRSPAFQPSFSTIPVQSRQKMTSVRPPSTPSNGQSYRNQSI